MKIVAVTFSEGGRWNHPPGDDCLGNSFVHSIMFEDGSVWDSWNGYRKRKQLPPPWVTPQHDFDLENKVPKQARRA